MSHMNHNMNRIITSNASSSSATSPLKNIITIPDQKEQSLDSANHGNGTNNNHGMMKSHLLRNHSNASSSMQSIGLSSLTPIDLTSTNTTSTALIYSSPTDTTNTTPTTTTDTPCLMMISDLNGGNGIMSRKKPNSGSNNNTSPPRWKLNNANPNIQNVTNNNGVPNLQNRYTFVGGISGNNNNISHTHSLISPPMKIPHFASQTLSAKNFVQNGNKRRKTSLLTGNNGNNNNGSNSNGVVPTLGVNIGIGGSYNNLALQKLRRDLENGRSSSSSSHMQIPGGNDVTNHIVSGHHLSRSSSLSHNPHQQQQQPSIEQQQSASIVQQQSIDIRRLSQALHNRNINRQTYTKLLHALRAMTAQKSQSQHPNNNNQSNIGGFHNIPTPSPTLSPNNNNNQNYSNLSPNLQNIIQTLARNLKLQQMNTHQQNQNNNNNNVGNHMNGNFVNTATNQNNATNQTHNRIHLNTNTNNNGMIPMFSVSSHNNGAYPITDAVQTKALFQHKISRPNMAHRSHSHYQHSQHNSHSSSMINSKSSSPILQINPNQPKQSKKRPIECIDITNDDDNEDDDIIVHKSIEKNDENDDDDDDDDVVALAPPRNDIGRSLADLPKLCIETASSSAPSVVASSCEEVVVTNQKLQNNEQMSEHVSMPSKSDGDVEIITDVKENMDNLLQVFKLGGKERRNHSNNNNNNGNTTHHRRNSGRRPKRYCNLAKNEEKLNKEMARPVSSNPYIIALAEQLHLEDMEMGETDFFPILTKMPRVDLIKYIEYYKIRCSRRQTDERLLQYVTKHFFAHNKAQNKSCDELEQQLFWHVICDDQ